MKEDKQTIHEYARIQRKLMDRTNCCNYRSTRKCELPQQNRSNISGALKGHACAAPLVAPIT